MSDLVVTKNGVPFTDQAEGIRQLKEACRQKPASGLVERLCHTSTMFGASRSDAIEAADRIEELERQVREARAVALEEAAKHHDDEAGKLWKLLNARNHNRSIADNFRSQFIQHQRHAAAIMAMKDTAGGECIRKLAEGGEG